MVSVVRLDPRIDETFKALTDMVDPNKVLGASVLVLKVETSNVERSILLPIDVETCNVEIPAVLMIKLEISVFTARIKFTSNDDAISDDANTPTVTMEEAK